MTVTPEHSTLQAARAHGDKDLADLLRTTAARHGVPGAVIAVSHDGHRRTAAFGLANQRTHVEMTPDTLVGVGSLAKVWTSALTLRLVEKGALSLDQPVRLYLPGFTLADREASEQLTIRHLLSHGGGFHGESMSDFGPGDDALGRYVDSLSHVSQLHPPGELFSYCNAGFNLLGHVLATVDGATWEQQVRDHVTLPLKLDGVAVTSDEAMFFRNSVGHTVVADEAHVVIPVQQPQRSCSPTGAKLRMSCLAVLSFCEAYLRPSLSGAASRFLSTESRAAMTRPEVAVPGSTMADHWSLGWALWDCGSARAFGHDGEYSGQSLFVRNLSDHGLSVVLAVNGGRDRAMYEDTVPGLVEELCGVRMPRAPEPPEPLTRLPATKAQRCAGTYRGPHGTFKVSPASEGHGLDIRATSPREAGRPPGAGRPERYAWLRDDTFVAEGKGHGPYRTLSFVGDAGGPARYLHNSRAHARADDDPAG
ncbi:serine hydrolase domain-containing protein [Kitasatospora sp. NPDC101183]|uniref:serine hydrolase domain-containing protein n=1 Tax=Kitasatospora sp. NPDC101183 TaxID=3364100 RepID=UPI00381708B8